MTRHEQAEKDATILYVYLNKNNLPESRDGVDHVIDKVFTGDNGKIGDILKPWFQKILQVLGGAPKSKGKGAPRIDIKNVNGLCQALRVRMEPLLEGTRQIHLAGETTSNLANSAFVKTNRPNDEFLDFLRKFDEDLRSMFIELGEVITTELPKLIERVSVDEHVAQLIEFNNKLKETQNINPIEQIMIDGRKTNCFFAVYMPVDKRPVNGSDHITIGHDLVDRERFLHLLGTVINVQLAKENQYHDIESADGKNVDKYAYRPVRLTDKDDNVFYSHTSIHFEGCGPSQKRNHDHQKTLDHDTLEWEDETFESLVLTFAPHGENGIHMYQKDGTRFYASLDMDKTILKPESTHNDKGMHDDKYLHDPSRIDAKYMTDFAKFVKNLSIPFMVNTARHMKSNDEKREMFANVQKMMPNCVLFCTGRQNRLNGSARDDFKACGKRDNRPSTCMHFDDELRPLEMMGFGGHIVDGSLPTHYHADKLSGVHTHFAVFGHVGVGKTTTIKTFLKKVGYRPPGSDREGPVAAHCAADGSDPTFDLLPISAMAGRHPDNETCLIVDTTGDGRAVTTTENEDGNDVTKSRSPMPTVYLAPQRTWQNIGGCLLSLMTRTDHPNLNGFVKVDLESPPGEEFEFDTNSMSLPEFINYVWFLNDNTKAFTDYFERLGQTANFKQYGNLLYVHTSYQEGRQKWNAKWGRQNRNAYHVLYNGRWYTIKLGLEVGMENKPTKHADKGDWYSSRGGLTQIEICRRLFTGEPLPEGTVITFKRDGALGQLVLVQGESDFVKAIYDSTMASENPFARMLAEYSYNQFDGKQFFIIATNGTLFASEHMWDYLLTTVGWKLKRQNELFDLLKKEADPQFTKSLNKEGLSKDHQKHLPVLNAWSHLIPQFFEQERMMWMKAKLDNSIPSHVPVTSNVEAVCPERTTCTGTTHSELACKYPYGFMSFLGFRFIITDPKTNRLDGKYVPHSDVEDAVESGLYDQPRYRRVHDSREIMEMLKDLQRLSLDPEFTAEMFFEKYPVSNKYKPRAPGTLDDLIDHEGFVLLVALKEHFKGYDYGKLKTLLYYIFHKIREADMKLLVQLSQHPKLDLKHFPVADVIASTYSALESADFDAMYANVKMIMTEHAPSKPPANCNDRRAVGIYGAYEDKYADLPPDETGHTTPAWTHWTSFMYSQERPVGGKGKKAKSPSLPGKMSLKIHAEVLKTVNMEYIAQHYLHLVSLPTKGLTEAEKKQQKMVKNHLECIRSIVMKPDSDKIRRHMLYVGIHLLRKPVV